MFAKGKTTKFFSSKTMTQSMMMVLVVDDGGESVGRLRNRSIRTGNILTTRLLWSVSNVCAPIWLAHNKSVKVVLLYFSFIVAIVRIFGWAKIKLVYRHWQMSCIGTNLQIDSTSLWQRRILHFLLNFYFL